MLAGSHGAGSRVAGEWGKVEPEPGEALERES